MHPRRILTTTVVVTVALTAASAPAIAYPIGPGFGVRVTSHAATPTYSRQDKQVVTPSNYSAQQPAAGPAQPAAPANTPTGGFTALDVAIAAAGALALLLLVIGSVTAILRRRTESAHQPVVVTH